MLESGYYANMFEVRLVGDETNVVACSRSKYPSLKALRKEIEKDGKNAFVYAPGHSELVFGYGQDMAWLCDKGFEERVVELSKEPRLTGRMIFDGLILKAQSLGYAPSFPEIGRCRLFKWDSFSETSDGGVRVFRGYDLRVIFLRDDAADALTFNLIADMCHAFRSRDGQPLNFQTIKQQFGGATLRQVRQIQGDLIPTGMNTEVSRQRLIEVIHPFVEEVGQFELPTGISAQVVPVPLRIVVGAEHESLW